MSITIVTTTRDRAVCFALLERWLAKQTVQWDQWLVVNDGTEEYRYTMYQDVVERNPADDTLPSICHNWLAALPLIKGDKVIVVEDDDYYDARYLETISRMLDDVDLAGISHDVYFKLPTRRFVRMHNENHASLACTGWRSYLAPEVERTAKVFKSVYLDMYLWAECGPIWPGSKKLLRQPLADNRMLHVGMKLMPGARGLGLGHQDPMTGSTDPNFATLAQWIGGEAAGVYRRLWVDHFDQGAGWRCRPGAPAAR